MDEALDPANRGRFIAEATTDFAAQAVTAAKKKYEQDYSHQDLSALLWSARLPAQEKAQSASDQQDEQAGD